MVVYKSPSDEYIEEAIAYLDAQDVPLDNRKIEPPLDKEEVKALLAIKSKEELDGYCKMV